MKKCFKEKFWFESGSAWGDCETFEDFKYKLDLVIRDSGKMKFSVLLERIKQADRPYLDFGLRVEHIGGRPFSDYLKETEQYDDLIKYLNK